MRTNFFQALQRLHDAGAWVINVNFSAEHELIVSVLLKSQDGENQSLNCHQWFSRAQCRRLTRESFRG
ncbi:MAG: hypothetical protein ABWZ79_02015 [Pedobacter agri]